MKWLLSWLSIGPLLLATIVLVMIRGSVHRARMAHECRR
jgi:hypothetical protein